MPKIKRPKTLVELFCPELVASGITLADLKAVVDAAAAELPDGGQSVLLATPERINGQAMRRGAQGDNVCDPIPNVRLNIQTFLGRQYAVLELGD